MGEKSKFIKLISTILLSTNLLIVRCETWWDAT